jgi:hypothetical protein
MCDAFIKPDTHELFRRGSKVNRTSLRPESIILRLILIGFKNRAGVWSQVEDLKIQVCSISIKLSAVVTIIALCSQWSVMGRCWGLKIQQAGAKESICLPPHPKLLSGISSFTYWRTRPVFNSSQSTSTCNSEVSSRSIVASSKKWLPSRSRLNLVASREARIRVQR